jgi:hypothetical protein
MTVLPMAADAATVVASRDPLRLSNACQSALAGLNRNIPHSILLKRTSGPMATMKA